MHAGERVVLALVGGELQLAVEPAGEHEDVALVGTRRAEAGAALEAVDGRLVARPVGMPLAGTARRRLVAADVPDRRLRDVLGGGHGGEDTPLVTQADEPPDAGSRTSRFCQ